MSYGVPIVTSNVGACRELVLGVTEEDRALGQAGFVTATGNPHETAAAVRKILGDKKMWERMSRAGRARVERYYDKDRMVERYRGLYQAFTNRPEPSRTGR
jgi:glycosyltransferase involved in cell wall biosynthesis